jgi:uncharacterized protein (TIGR02996 family)
VNVESFLAALREEPDDDERRLVFADWLDDQGDAERGAFVRRQVETERLWDSLVASDGPYFTPRGVTLGSVTGGWHTSPGPTSWRD